MIDNNNLPNQMWLDELSLYKDEMSMKSKEFIEQKIFEKRG